MLSKTFRGFRLYVGGTPAVSRRQREREINATISPMDRKALTRAYKEAPRPMGVYPIRNTVNGKSLVASSINLPAILNRHQAALRLGGHTNKALQKDWNELGPEAFEFEVLDTLTPSAKPGDKPADDLLALEAMWIEKLSATEDLGYNPKAKRPA
jgi:hypothetical protein